MFKVTPGSPVPETVLYSFTGKSDGSDPHVGLVRDARGNLYGTTYGGGVSGFGAVFELTSSGTEKVVYSFSYNRPPSVALRASWGTDGAFSTAGLVMDEQGNLYGTTGEGGAYGCNNGFGCGTAFKLTPTGCGERAPRLHRLAEINAYDALYIPANDVPWFPYEQSGCATSNSSIRQQTVFSPNCGLSSSWMKPSASRLRKGQADCYDSSRNYSTTS